MTIGGTVMKDDRYGWRRAGSASTAGIVLVVCIAIGYFLGAWLDRTFGTDPWLMLVFTLLGVAAGFIEMFRIVLRVSKDD